MSRGTGIHNPPTCPQVDLAPSKCRCPSVELEPGPPPGEGGGRHPEGRVFEPGWFESPCGLPIVNPPDVPLYLFLGGTAGVCASIDALAALAFVGGRR